jgi:hypothetical protein
VNVVGVLYARMNTEFLNLLNHQKKETNVERRKIEEMNQFRL